MQGISGYRISETLYESERTVVYRAQRSADQRAVILKVFHKQLPSSEELARFRLEYEILREFDSEYVVKADALETHDGHLCIVMEDCGGVSLAQHLKRHQPDLEQALVLAIALTRALAEVHDKHIVHKDFNPGNILWLDCSQQAKIIDFGIATRLGSEFAKTQNLSNLAGTLSYIAPEQTGRMNRSTDQRADYYALGVTLYEILTGQLPFKKADPMEIVHAHIALVPAAPAQLYSAIPQTVSDIVMKLMAKMAEDRYQSALAIQEDLEACLQQIRHGGPFVNFAIAQSDRCSSLQISEKLYGREQQKAQLLQACAATRDGKATLVLVSGQAGIGKSALIGEVNRALAESQGFFISGKFEQFKREIPYFAFIQALRELMHQVTSASSIRTARWKEKLMDALGSSGQLIIEVVPELEWIIGAQAAAAEVGPTEAVLRFNLLFEKFIRVFVQDDAPLAIFLDDLQWADTASLKLLERLMLDQRRNHPLVIAAYRSNEVDSIHPLSQTLEKLSPPACNQCHIELSILGVADIAALLHDSLHCSTQQAQALARVCLDKTSGNPFFLRQFIHRLHELGLLLFDLNAKAWRWDLDAIAAAAITNNVADTLSARLQSLATDSLNALALAACIGDQFRLATLAEIAGTSRSQAALRLEPALQGGFVLPTDDNYRLPQHDETSNPGYRFLHDRVQQVAYALIDEGARPAAHLAIGRQMLKDAGAEVASDDLFAIVNHLNRGRSLLRDEAERLQLVELNLRACVKSKSASTDSSAAYGATAIELLGAQAWSSMPALARRVYEEAAEACALNGDFDKADRWAVAILENTTDLLDQVHAHRTRMHLILTAQGQFAQAIDYGLAVLKQLGFYIPRQAGLDEVLACQARVKALIGDKTPEDFLALPAMVDPRAQAALDLMYCLFPAIMFGEPGLMPMYALEQVSISMRYGNAPKSAYGYIAYCIILSAAFQDYDQAYRFGQTAIALARRPEAVEVSAGTVLMASYYTVFLKEPLQQCKELMYQNFESAYANGDLFTLSYGVIDHLVYCYYLGEDMEDLKRKSLDGINFVSKINQLSCLTYSRMTAQVFHNMALEIDKPWVISGDIFNEQHEASNYAIYNDYIGRAFLHFHKYIVAYLCLAYEEAFAYFAVYEQSREAVAGLYSYSLSFFYDSLIRLALYPDRDPAWQQQTLERVDNSISRLEAMAVHAPLNYRHKVRLIMAERSRVLGDAAAAMNLYDEAIHLAKESRLFVEEALANELAGRFWLQRDKADFAEIYLVRAYYGYARWGARAKLHNMENSYRFIKETIARRRVAQTWNVSVSESSSSTTSSSERLDLISIMKASRAISGEIELQALVTQVMQIMLENAGAQRCFLVLERAGELVIESGLDNSEAALAQPPRLPVALTEADAGLLSVALVQFAFRSKENCVLSDTTDYGGFSHDVYLRRVRPRSVMCLPVMGKGQVVGVLYFENKLLSDAFSQERIRVLTILAAQTAVSLENALLYAELEQKVRDRTQALSGALENLKKAQAQLVQSEKMAALGQLIAGVAHEVNTPLGAIRASASNIDGDFEFLQKELLTLFLALPPSSHALFMDFVRLALQAEPVFDSRERRALRRALAAELAQAGLANADALAEALADIGLSKELQSFRPLLEAAQHATVLQFVSHLAALKRNTANIHLAVERASKVVFALKNFSRQDSAGTQQKFQLVDGLESTLTLYQNQLRRSAEVVRRYSLNPELLGFPDELNQVWTNIIHNAIQAMDPPGRLDIEVCEGPGQTVLVRIGDNGKGIADDIKERIFEPFFTTKPMGEGTGLGLHIAREIVQRHRGEISVESRPGHTVFTVSLPLP